MIKMAKKNCVSGFSICRCFLSGSQIKRDWKPLEERSCTDIPWLILFSLFCIGMVPSAFTLPTAPLTKGHL